MFFSAGGWKAACATAAFLLSLGLLYAAVRPACYVGRFNDDVRHFLAARSILQGHYRQLATPDGGHISNLLPGYPLLLAPAVRLGGAAAGQWENILFSVLYTGLLFILFNRNRPLAVLAGLHPALTLLAGSMMTEPSYLFFTTLALLLYDRGGGSSAPAVMLAAGFSVWLRPHGALLLVALVPFLLSERRDRKTLSYILCGAALAVLPFAYNMLAAGTPASYFSEIPRAAGLWATVSAQLQNIFSNILFTFKMLPVFVIAAEFSDAADSALVYPYAVVFWCVFAAGIYRTAGSGSAGARSRMAYTLAVLLMHLYWVNQSSRYYLVILPFALELCHAGLFFMPRAMKQLLLGGFLLTFGVVNFQLVQSARSGAPRLSGPVNTAGWIKTHTPPDSVIMSTYKERTFYLTGRKSQGFYYAANPDAWYARVCGLGIDYLLVEPRDSIIKTTPRRSFELDRLYGCIDRAAADPLRLRREFGDPGENTEIYRVLCPPEFLEADRLMREALQLSYAGDFKGALKIMERIRAEKLDRLLQRFSFTYGTTLLLAGDSVAAQAMLERVVKSEPDFEAARANFLRAKAAAEKTPPRPGNR